MTKEFSTLAYCEIRLRATVAESRRRMRRRVKAGMTPESEDALDDDTPAGVCEKREASLDGGKKGGERKEGNKRIGIRGN